MRQNLNPNPDPEVQKSLEDNVMSTEPNQARTSLPKKPLSEWSNEELRIKVAELCGFKNVLTGAFGDVWADDADRMGDYPAARIEVPNYPADLNAMAEAEKVLTDDQHQYFRNELKKQCCGDWIDSPVGAYPSVERLYQSRSARQRAIVFVATLNPEVL